MSFPYGQIKPLPTKYIPESDWRFAFDQIQLTITTNSYNSPIFVHSKTAFRGSKNEAFKAEACQVEQMNIDLLQLALYRVCQQYIDPVNYKFPCRLEKAQRAYLEAWGDYWYQLLRLCERLHSYQNLGYQNAAHWFMCLVNEWHNTKILSIAVGNVEGGRSAMIDLINDDLKKIKEGLRSKVADLPVRNQLLWIAVDTLGGTKSQFRRQYWQPFLKAYVAWRDQIKTNSCICSIAQTTDKQGRLRFQINRGTKSGKGKSYLNKWKDKPL
jgi:hypothetical protein